MQQLVKAGRKLQLAKVFGDDRRKSVNEDHSSSDRADERRQDDKEITEVRYDSDSSERLDSGRGLYRMYIYIHTRPFTAAFVT